MVHKPENSLWAPTQHRAEWRLGGAVSGVLCLISAVTYPCQPPRYSSYNPVSASVSVSPSQLRFPAFPTPSPHRCAAATRRLSTTVAPLRLRKSVGQPGQEWVSGFHPEVPVTLSQVGTRPTTACDSVTWGQDRYNSCSVVIAGPWQMDFPYSQALRRPFSGCRSSTAEDVCSICLAERDGDRESTGMNCTLDGLLK